ncbi:transposable element Tcb2 transposase [Trichonephila clavipes]|uniref:Transposable element Tcb2 transposase n=1 Tax=Trichonephila clavipes TaxID=2585209 RepID=A0A8X6S0Z0_TRICX|nr:transposable element Tcb2 transposase [Trichonephila clavipes]
MSSRYHIDDFMRGRIIGKIEEGRKITGVAREFDIAHSVVSRLWKSFKTTGMCNNNATCHRTLAVQDCLDSEGIQRLVWPARSPDLNPIENVWDALGRQVAGRNHPPTNKNTLIRALTEEWDKLPQQLLDNVVQSMVRRVECCITLHGGHIPY